MLSNPFQAYDVMLFVCGFLPNHAPIKYVCLIKQIGFLNLAQDSLFPISMLPKLSWHLPKTNPVFGPKFVSIFCPNHPYIEG